MKNLYQSYSDFMIRQPFFSFDVKHYQEAVQKTPFAARYYQFSTHKIIDRTNENLFMCCIPDGCVDIVFIRHNQQNKMELIGSPFCRKSLIVYPHADYFGVRLKPGMFFPNHEVCLKEITNTETFVPQIPADTALLLEQIFETDTLWERARLFQEYLLRFSPEQYIVEETVQQVLYLTSHANGNVEVGDIAKEICYSERHLTRMMEHSADSVSSFIDLLNYADQAHFQREFKEFTGITPKHFTRYYRNVVCPAEKEADLP